MMLMSYSRQLGKIGGMNYGNKQRSKNKKGICTAQYSTINRVRIGWFSYHAGV